LKIVIDSNVLFSALIKDAITRDIILHYDGYFLFPSYIFEEMEKHKQELVKKSKMKPKDFNTLLSILLQKVIIIPTEILFPYKQKALEIVKNIDKDDAIFIACALRYQPCVLWTDDKKLKQQSNITIVNTTEMMKLYVPASSKKNKKTYY